MPKHSGKRGNRCSGTSYSFMGCLKRCNVVRCSGFDSLDVCNPLPQPNRYHDDFNQCYRACRQHRLLLARECDQCRWYQCLVCHEEL